MFKHTSQGIIWEYTKDKVDLYIKVKGKKVLLDREEIDLNTKEVKEIKAQQQEKENEKISTVEKIFNKLTAYSIVNNTGWSYPNVTSAIAKALEEEGDSYENAIKILS